MKKHHYLIIGIIIIEILFLTITNAFQYQQEISLTDKEAPCTTDKAFTIHFDKSYFNFIYQKKQEVIKGNISNRVLSLSSGVKKIPRNLVDLVPDINCIELFNFHQNGLEEFPEAIVDFPNTRIVDLSYNNLQSLDFQDSMIQFNQVKELDLSGNPMTSINENITKFPNLKYLHLKYMPNLVNVSDEIKKLEKLVVIDFTSSPISNNYYKISKINHWVEENQNWKSEK